MSDQLQTPVEIDTAIDQQLSVVERINRDIATQLRYRDSETAYLRHHFDESEYERLLAERDAEREALKRLQDQYTGWERYFHVTNVNGHIHTSMSCSSCFPETTFGWRTDLSGLTAEQVVEREAYNACSVCMPIAPAEQKAARKRYNDEQRQARKAEKDAKAAQKRSRAAERAKKLMAKVDAAYESKGGYEAVMALDLHTVYEWTAIELPTTVGDVISDDYQERHERRSRYNKDPRKVIAEYEEAS